MTKIEWADESLNIVTGCTKVSLGCKNCYAERMAKRLKAMGQEAYQDATDKNGWTGKIGIIEERIEIPGKWKKPRTIFLNSMSDTFHEDLEDFQINRMLMGVYAWNWHRFIFVTKRSERAKELINNFCAIFNDGEPIPNLWLLVSVEDQKAADQRIPHLLRTNVVIRGLSMEPLLGHVDLISSDYQTSFLHPFEKDTKIDWIIVGGESGPGARPMNPEWARSIRDQCDDNDVNTKFFFKQWGAWMPKKMAHEANIIPSETRNIFGLCQVAMSRVGKKKSGRLLDGREWNEYPDHRGKEDEK